MIQMNIFNVTVFLSRYFWAVRFPPQDSKRNEEERWGITAGMRPIGSTNHQWGMKKPPLQDPKEISGGSFHSM
ncbi:hypothetical protein [Bacillus sp. GB_SG_008]|uniref:hypothetical protein n=1 Tax=Bacillus sp. GB_SG_008 TaxID=3454627 RepID=UPI003F863408